MDYFLKEILSSQSPPLAGRLLGWKQGAGSCPEVGTGLENGEVEDRVREVPDRRFGHDRNQGEL